MPLCFRFFIVLFFVLLVACKPTYQISERGYKKRNHTYDYNTQTTLVLSQSTIPNVYYSKALPKDSLHTSAAPAQKITTTLPTQDTTKSPINDTLNSQDDDLTDSDDSDADTTADSTPNGEMDSIIALKNTEFAFDTLTMQIVIMSKETQIRDTLWLKNKILFNDILSWIGSKYKYAGTSEKGIDCSGLTSRFILNAYQITIPRSAHEQYKKSTPITTANLREGDLVFFKTRGRRISHVGVYLSQNYFVHASTSLGVTISSLNEAYWSKRYVKCGRYE